MSEANGIPVGLGADITDLRLRMLLEKKNPAIAIVATSDKQSTPEQIAGNFADLNCILKISDLQLDIDQDLISDIEEPASSDD